MKHLFLSMAVLCTWAAAADATTLYVSTTAGTVRTGTQDQPFATVQEAQQAARRVKPTRANPVQVKLAPGDYLLSEPLLFTPADSDTAWTGAAGGQSRLLGARRLTGWTAVSPTRWEAPVPRDANGRPLWFEQLYVNGRRLKRARHPNAGFFTPQAVAETKLTNDVTKAVYAQASLTGRNQDLAPLDACPAEALRFAHLVVHHNWDTTRRIIAGFDAASQTVRTQGEIWTHWNPWRPNSQYYVENVPAALDEPGEWLYDGAANKIVYLPRPGEAIDASTFLFPEPGLKQLVVIKGEPAKDVFVERLSFTDLAFEYTDSPRRTTYLRDANLPESVTGPVDALGPSQWPPAQASSHTEAAILADGAHDVSFLRCRLAHTGEYGVWFREGCVSNRLETCDLVDLGAGGIRIGLPNPTQTVRQGEHVTALTNGRGTGYNVVDDCRILHGGRIHAPGVAVWIGASPFNTITHCDIRDHYYTGVSIGWVWGYPGSLAQGNTLSYCRIEDIGQRVLADMGGLYTLGTSYGTRVANNVIRNVDSYSYGGWGLYTDEGSEGIVLENNLVVDTKDGSFHQHYGKDNIVRNNILVNSRQCQVASTRKENHRPFTFERNIVYSDKGPMVATRYAGSDQPTIEWRSNLWWRAGAPADFCGKTFADWQAKGRDAGSQLADPLFVDAARGDYRLRPESPAFALGFKPFDPGEAGIRTKRP